MEGIDQITDQELRDLRSATERQLRPFNDDEYGENKFIYDTLRDIDAEYRRRTNERQKAKTPIAAQWVEGGDAVVYIPFSAYELANIAEMFKAITPYRFLTTEEREKVLKGEKLPLNPFSVFDSGDWCGVVADRFVKMANQYASGTGPPRGNQSAEEYRFNAIRLVGRALDAEEEK